MQSYYFMRVASPDLIVRRLIIKSKSEEDGAGSQNKLGNTTSLAGDGACRILSKFKSSVISYNWTLRREWLVELKSRSACWSASVVSL